MAHMCYNVLNVTFAAKMDNYRRNIVMRQSEQVELLTKYLRYVVHISDKFIHTFTHVHHMSLMYELWDE